MYFNPFYVEYTIFCVNIVKGVKKTPLSKSKKRSASKHLPLVDRSSMQRNKTPRKVCFSSTVSSDPKTRKRNADMNVADTSLGVERVDTRLGFLFIVLPSFNNKLLRPLLTLHSFSWAKAKLHVPSSSLCVLFTLAHIKTRNKKINPDRRNMKLGIEIVFKIPGNLVYIYVPKDDYNCYYI